MLRLLRIEWMKIKNYRTFWILLAISIVSMPAFNYVVYDVTNNTFPKVQGKNLLGTPFSFPYVWQTVSWNSSLLLLIPAVLIITLTTNEFTYRTHRQNIIDGWSRGEFINVKLFQIFLLSVFITLVVIITTLVFGYSTTAGTISAFENIRFAGFFFVEMLSYSLIAFLLAMFIKRAGLAMGAFFIYLIIEQLIVGILRHKYKQAGVDYLPQEVTDMLIPQPYAQRFTSPEKLTTWENHLPAYLAVCAVYLIAYCLITNWKFRKSDL